MKTQQELKALAQVRNDIVNEDCFVDVSRCDVCGSHDIIFSERINGVIANCQDCAKYQESRK